MRHLKHLTLSSGLVVALLTSNLVYADYADTIRFDEDRYMLVSQNQEDTQLTAVYQEVSAEQPRSAKHIAITYLSDHTQLQGAATDLLEALKQNPNVLNHQGEERQNGAEFLIHYMSQQLTPTPCFELNVVRLVNTNDHLIRYHFTYRVTNDNLKNTLQQDFGSMSGFNRKRREWIERITEVSWPTPSTEAANTKAQLALKR